MSFVLRDNQPTVVHCDSDVIRATLGIQEYLARPTVTLEACYAVPKAGSSRSQQVDATCQTPVEGDAEAPESTGKSLWLVGSDLEKAMAEGGWEERWEVRWPFRQSKQADDWEGREFVLTHLYSLLGIRLPSNTSPLLFVPPPSPPSLPLPDQAMYCQLAFEQLNVPGFSVMPSPLASLFALNATTGIILHVSRTTSEVAIIVDSQVRWECSTTVEIGQEDCEKWFVRLLMEDSALERELQAAAGESWEGAKEKLVKEVADFVWRECTGEDIEVPPAQIASKAFVAAAAVTTETEEADFDVAKKLIGEAATAPSAPSHKSKKAQQAANAAANKAAADAAAAEAAAQADVITITIPSLPDKEIALGPVRHRLCEPLLKGKQAGGETVWEGIGRAVESASLSVLEKMAIWEGIGVVGELARVKSFAPALITYLAPFLLSSPDLPSEYQPARVRLLSIPDYFTNFKGATSDLAPFLGASMVAKVAFSDAAGRHCITKVDYNANGPAAIYTVMNEE